MSFSEKLHQEFYNAVVPSLIEDWAIPGYVELIIEFAFWAIIVLKVLPWICDIWDRINHRW